ncbi:MAG: hypothetical protein JWO77_1438 [Ilumatobacteraceae bacterium]|nr:hypothetical protein [Ilumatobacteraceae bacterium]
MTNQHPPDPYRLPSFTQAESVSAQLRDLDLDQLERFTSQYEAFDNSPASALPADGIRVIADALSWIGDPLSASWQALAAEIEDRQEFDRIVATLRRSPT